MPTVQDCIDGLHVSYPQVEDAQALIYFRQVHRDLLANAQIETGEELLDLTAGQREYALDQTDKIVVVRAAYFIKSAQDATKLTPVSTDWLDTYDPTWRTSTQQGRPQRFYIEDGKVGLDPVPDTTTAAGFPQVALYGTTYQALVTTDEVPEIVPTVRVYVEGMKRLYASDRDPALFAQWDAIYQSELHKALAHINGQVEDLESPRLVPTWMKNRRVL
jgi:hypothetical protein